MEEPFDMFPDDQAAMKWFEAMIWENGRVCPHCTSDRTCEAKHPDMPYYCSQCKKYFSIRTNTVMSHSKLSYHKWAIAIYLVATRPKGISSTQLAHDLGIRQPPAWYLLQRIRETWGNLVDPEKLSGPVEGDEAYPGGREKNRHADKKGRKKKVAVLGTRDRATGEIRAVPIP